MNSIIVSPTTRINKSRSSTNCCKSPWLRKASWLMTVSRSSVAKVAALITEKADLLKDLAMRRKSYQDEVKESSKGKSAAGSTAPKKQKTTGVPASPATSQPTPLPTAHGGKAMEVDTQSSTSQPSGAPFPYPFTHTPSQSGTLSAPSQSVPPSVPAPPTRPEDQQDDQNADEPTQKGIQPGAPPIPRSFCDDILTVPANLPEEWPLVKIDLILSKAETYYVSWRRFCTSMSACVPWMQIPLHAQLTETFFCSQANWSM